MAAKSGKICHNLAQIFLSGMEGPHVEADTLKLLNSTLFEWKGSLLVNFEAEFFCSVFPVFVNIAIFLKYVRPFFNIMKERVKLSEEIYE